MELTKKEIQTDLQDQHLKDTQRIFHVTPSFSAKIIWLLYNCIMDLVGWRCRCPSIFKKNIINVFCKAYKKDKYSHHSLQVKFRSYFLVPETHLYGVKIKKGPHGTLKQ
ncbi:UNVERIFIED_CONTAM: hypothetical protein K2H54_028851 [Gekko kuhli]